jgi:hypothetical protein
MLFVVNNLPKWVGAVLWAIFSTNSSAADFSYIFRGKFWGKFFRKSPPKKCQGKFEFSAEKVLKNNFPKNFRGKKERKIGPWSPCS